MANELISRTELQASRSSLRRCFTGLKASITAWDEAYENGRSALEEFCNAKLKQTHADHFALGTLSHIRDLKEAASRKIRLLLHEAQETLRESLISLLCVVNNMKEIHKQLERQVSGLQVTVNNAVFSCLTLKQYSSMLARIVSSYDMQLQVRPHLLHGDNH
jgi:hypothetical protein